MQQYVCIHGHFYQPPRENPWLEEIEIQDEAYPFHDWNERITDECYAPNAAARILNEQGQILEIVNNYAKISFNFGPTLLTWLEQHAPEVYAAILRADEESSRRFGGHGSALAQVYNHMIMPLASERDKRTQTIWGVRDFEHRFGRKPAGMWLSETAVDVASLEALAEQGIRFTILEPHQAQRVRPLKGGDWTEVPGGMVDTSVPYTVKLPSGGQIAVFFYDGAASRAVAFENLLDDGEVFARRITDTLNNGDDGPRLAHIATDGETYGHHHRFGDMALAYALQYIEDHDLAHLTNYAQFLELCPPGHEAEIVPNTSWSCAHGVERWRSACGCGAGPDPGWSLEWRAPLREALDCLRDQLEQPYEELASTLFVDPWGARDEYISIILDRSRPNVDRVLTGLAERSLSESETVQALKLLEMQRQLMLMYTSCGWFFEDVGRIETVQILEYAARAMQLADDLFGMSFEAPFIDILRKAESNDPEMGNGAQIFRSEVQPAVVSLPAVGAHYAMISLFNGREDVTEIYCYDAEQLEYHLHSAGRARIALGRIRLTSQITQEHVNLGFGVLHLGDHNIDAGVREYPTLVEFNAMQDAVTTAFRGADIPGTVRSLDRHFGEHSYSLSSLFRDEQRRILGQVLDSTLGDVETVYRHLYEDHESLIHFLDGLGAPLPRSLRVTADFVINTDLRRAFLSGNVDPDEVLLLFQVTRNWGLELDFPGLSFVLEQTIERRARQLRRHPGRMGPIKRLTGLVSLCLLLPFTVDLRSAQNDYYHVLTTGYPEMKAQADAGDPVAGRWVTEFVALGKALSVHVG